MENKNKEPNSKIDSETRSKLFDFYESVKKGNQVLSSEELEIAIETLKLAQQTVKQNNRTNVRPQITVSKKTEQNQVIPSKPVVAVTAVKEKIPTNKALKLPAYNWFVTIHDGKPASNTFTGSCRKDSTKGCLSTTTFNYKVSVSDVGKDTAKIIVNCFKQLPWYKGALRKNLADTEYECSPKGLEKATKWLNAQWQKFMEDEKNE